MTNGNEKGWRTLSGRQWVARLIDEPSLADQCDWSRFYGNDWAEFLSARPQFTGRCEAWDEMDDDDVLKLIRRHPGLTPHFPKARLEGLKGKPEEISDEVEDFFESR